MPRTSSAATCSAKGATSRGASRARAQRRRRSAYGVVYAAEWRNIQVAVKEIKGDALGELHGAALVRWRAAVDKRRRATSSVAAQAKATTDFQNEMMTLCQIKAHVNILQLYGVCLEPLSIVTEFAVDGSLFDYLRTSDGRALTIDERTALILGAARGVAHLHAVRRARGRGW